MYYILLAEFTNFIPSQRLLNFWFWWLNFFIHQIFRWFYNMLHFSIEHLVIHDFFRFIIRHKYKQFRFSSEIFQFTVKCQPHIEKLSKFYSDFRKTRPNRIKMILFLSIGFELISALEFTKIYLQSMFSLLYYFSGQSFNKNIYSLAISLPCFKTWR